MATTPGHPDPVASSGRRSEMDALRALVVVGLVFFHSALVFDSEDDFYVKNDDTAPLLLLAGPVVVWAMPLLFVIAGFGARQSLLRRGPGGFALERLRRLGVPLVVASVLLLPIPPWLRLRAAGDDESYLAFCRRFFDVHLSAGELPFLVRGDEFETGHLWFVVLLLCFSLVLAVPAALLAQRRAAPRADAVVRAVARRPALLLAGGLPVAAVSAGLGLEEEYGGWHRAAYLVFFAAGLLLVGDPRVRDAVRRCAPVALAVAVALFAVGAPLFVTTDEPFTETSVAAVLGRAAFGATGWCAVLAILGLLDRPRRSARAAGTTRTAATARASAYLGDAVLPLYVLHQPVVVVVAYLVVGWDLAAPVKYVVIVAASLALTVGAYDLLVRRTPVTRFLLGMR